MRFPLSLLAVYALIHVIVAQSIINDVNCDFQYRNQLYTCLLNDTIIDKESNQLRFSGVHLPNHDDSHVAGIDASFVTRQNNIRVVHPQLLQQYPNVQVMNLRNSLVLILVDNSFSRCDELTWLILNDNSILTIPPKVFQNCTKLETLELSNNNLGFLTAESFEGLQNLQTLTLASSWFIQVISNAFQSLTNLRFLDLSNQFSPTLGANTFHGLQNLEVLFLNNIPLPNNLIAGTFDPLQNLQILHLRNVAMNSIPPNVFTPLTNLRSLELVHNTITRLNSNSFGHLPNLETFIISHSSWDLGLTAIERNFFTNFPRLVEFGGPTGNSCAGRVSGVINMTTIDFSRETVFDDCFYFWEGISTTTTTTTVPSTTTESNGATDVATKFSLPIIVIGMIRVLVF